MRTRQILAAEWTGLCLTLSLSWAAADVVTIKIPGYGQIAGRAKLNGLERAASTLQDVPLPAAEHSKVRLAIAVVITLDRKIRTGAPLRGVEAMITAELDVPTSVRRPENRSIGLSVAIVIARDRTVASRSKMA